MRRFYSHLICSILFVLALAGCGSDAPYPLAPASGSVRYEDGSIPQGEECFVVFNPILSEEERESQLHPAKAHGEIKKDGSFEMSLHRPTANGIPVGDHKVTFRIFDRYEGGKPLVPDKYMNVETTPFTVTVPSGGKADYEFVIPKRK